MGEEVVVGRGAHATEVRIVDRLVEVALYRWLKQEGAEDHKEELIWAPLRVGALPQPTGSLQLTQTLVGESEQLIEDGLARWGRLKQRPTDVLAHYGALSNHVRNNAFFFNTFFVLS